MWTLPSPWLISRFVCSRRRSLYALLFSPFLPRFSLQNKLEAQYAARRDAHISEVADLKQQLEMRNNEVRSLNASAESLKSVNEELKVGLWRHA
jgi:hypothetical protein